MIVISFLYPEPFIEEKNKLVWKSLLEPLREKDRPAISNYKLLSGVLALTMIALYIIFTFFVN